MNHNRISLYRITLAFLLFSFVMFGAAAELRVVTTYPYSREIVKEIGGERVDVAALSKAQWDPHVVVPKPSLIALVRKADLLVINGAQLEIGWLPPLLQQANNPQVLPSKKGFIDLSDHIELIQKPDSVSRAGGDVHPAGNPHFHLNPHNIPSMARLLAEKLSELDTEGQSVYMQNLNRFLSEWEGYLVSWAEQMAPLKGKQVIEYHRNLDYFMIQYGVAVAATVELLPGIPPTTKHMMGLIDQIKRDKVLFILHDVYHNDKCSRYLSKETGIPVVVLPHDVGAVKEADSLKGLYDTIVNRLVAR